MRAKAFTTAFAIVLGALLWAPTASAASIVVSPTSVPVGGTVTLSGDVLGPGGTPGCTVPGTVTLLSDALAGHGQFQAPGIQGPVGANAKFSIQTTILAGVAPGTYTITGRCGGGNLGVSATLTVVPSMPRTGAGGGQTPPVLPGVLLFAAGIVVAVGAMSLTRAARRRP
jgi:hypothetical protein